MPLDSDSLVLTTLGALSVRRAGPHGDEVLSGQPALLFAYLVDRGSPQPRSELAALFWPEVAPSKARHGLRQLGHFEADIVVAEVDGTRTPRRLTPAGRDDNCLWLSDEHLLYRSWRDGAGDFFVQGSNPWSRAENVSLLPGEPAAPFVVRKP